MEFNLYSVAIVVSFVLVILKLTGLVALTWVQCFIPIFLIIGIIVLVLVCMFLAYCTIAIIGAFKDHKK